MTMVRMYKTGAWFTSVVSSPGDKLLRLLRRCRGLSNCKRGTRTKLLPLVIPKVVPTCSMIDNCTFSSFTYKTSKKLTCFKAHALKPAFKKVTMRQIKYFGDTSGIYRIFWWGHVTYKNYSYNKCIYTECHLL